MQALSDAHHPAPVRERPVCAAPATPPARADDTTSAQRVHQANVRSACTQHSVVKSRHLTDGPVHTATEGGGSELSADNRKSDPERGREANKLEYIFRFCLFQRVAALFQVEV